MRITILGVAGAAAVILAAPAAAQQSPADTVHAKHGAHGQAATDSMHAKHGAHGHAAGDSAYTALQQRGQQVMGVDQYSSTHVFDTLADGGRIELQRDVDDAAGIAVIRAHLRDIAQRFAAGDFSPSAAVHAQDVPGTKVMAQKRDAIRYTFRELPRGGEVRITTTDLQALAAVHEFLAFQRQDHRAGGNH